MYQHIMLPFDGSDLSLKAVHEGVTLAKALGSKMTLITVIAPYHTGITSPITSSSVHELERRHEEESKKDARKLHTDIVARAKSEGVECDSLVVVSNSLYAQIIESAKTRNCDLIVMASHGRRGLDAVLLGSETVKVLTHSKIPVLVVR
jgi:nucleotide-binding universal stress UspA family protein